jgi:hypothetical protein
MSERQKEMNRKYWDGLHAFSPKCYTCALIETDWCLGCQGNGSGEGVYYTGRDEIEAETPVLCEGCCHLEDIFPIQCSYCANNSNYEEAD